MTSHKNKGEILSLSRRKKKKHVNERKDQQCMPTVEYDAENQNCISKNKTDKKLIVSFNSHRTIRKRKANEDGSSKTRKTMRATSGSKITQESDVISNSPPLFDDKVSDSDLIGISDSDLIVISETESYNSPFGDHVESVSNCGQSELCHENALSVSDDKLHSSHFCTKSPSSVPSISGPSSTTNLRVKEDDKHTSYHSTFEAVNVLSELEIHTDVDFNGSVELNGSNLNNTDPKSYDIVTLLLKRLNEVKNSKENFICNELKIQPIIQPEGFNYEHNFPCSIAVDISMLRAANDYIEENSSKYDDSPVIPPNFHLENSWQSSLIRLNDDLNFVNFNNKDSDTFSEVSISSCNTADIQLDFFGINCSESPKKSIEISDNSENLNNVVNFMHSQDLNVGIKETTDTRTQNSLCENADLLNDVEKSIKLCPKVKRKRKKMNWYPKKRRCRKRKGTMPEVKSLSDEILCDTCEESDVDENYDLAPPLNVPYVSTSPCLEKTSVTEIFKNKIMMVENSNNEKHNSCKEKSQRTTRSTVKPESKGNKKSVNVKGIPDTIPQVPVEEFCFGTDEQFSKDDRVKQCMSEMSNSIETDVSSKIKCGNLGSVSIVSTDYDVSGYNKSTRNPDLSSRTVDNNSSEVCEQNSKTGRSLSLDDERNIITSKLNSERKDIKLLGGLIVGLERLDELTLKKYSKVSNVQGKSDRNIDPSTEVGSSHADVGDSEPSCSSSGETQVSFTCLQKDVQLCASEEMDLKGKLSISKRAKHALACRSKSEENSLSKDLEVSKHLKNGVKDMTKTKRKLKILDNDSCENDKRHLDVLRSESEERNISEVLKPSNNLEKSDSSETKVSSPFKESNIVLEQELYDNGIKLKDKDITDASGSNKLTEKHVKTVDLCNTDIILPGDGSDSISDKQCISVLNSKRGEKGTSDDFELSKHSKKHFKTVGSTNKKIVLHGKESKKVSSKQKQHVMSWKSETENTGCAEDSELNNYSEKHLKNNSPETKILSAGEESNISLKPKPYISSSKSRGDANFTSDLSKTICTTTGGETDVSSEGNTNVLDHCSASKGVNQNKKCKNNNNSVKKSKAEITMLSSKNINGKNEVKLSRKLSNESSKSVPHLTNSSDTGRRDSKNLKAKEDSKNNGEEKNKLKNSVKKLNSNSNPVSENLSNKNFDMVNATLPISGNYNLSDQSNFSEKVRSMKPIPKLSHKKKIKISASHMNQGEESRKDSSSVKLTIDSIANVQSPSTQTSVFENNACDMSSLKPHDDTSEMVILTEDDCLDFELDQSEDLTVKHSVCNSMTESSLTITGHISNEVQPSLQEELTFNSCGAPKSDAIYSGSNPISKDSLVTEHNSTLQESKGTDSEYPYNDLIYKRKVFTPPDNDMLSEDDSDSDDEHSFKRTRYGRKENGMEETSVNLGSLNSFDENSAVQNQRDKYQMEPAGLNEVCNSSISPVSISTKSESFKRSWEDQDLDSSKGVQTNCLKSKVSTGSVAHLNDVLAQIQDHCSKELFNEAVEVAKTYFAISTNDINKCILEGLLNSIFEFILRSHKDNNSTFKILDDIVELICRYEICNQQIASYFITKCCSQPDLSTYSRKLFHICHRQNIPLDHKALKAFSLILILNSDLHIILDFASYVKVVCNKKVSKELVHLALKKCETLPFPDIHHTCSLMQSITPKEVDEQNLKDFILLCFEKNMWQHVAEMFIAWSTGNSLSISIYSALMADYETMGKYFRKFANYVHEKEGSLRPELKDRLTPELKARFGQMGIALMLNAFSSSYMGIALDVLYTLHTYNVNYFELQLIVRSSSSTQSNSEIENYIKVFPFSVVFIAVDICLYHNRPKDAFTIFQVFSWVMPDESLDDAVRLYVVKGRYQRLLKLVPLLNTQESINEGWEALENLLTTVKKDLTDEIVQENIEDLVSTYNKYLVSLLNFQKIPLAYILYQYSLGPKKDIFTIFPDVLRGLVVAFSEDGRTEDANSLFLLGVMKKIYPIQKPNLENFPWEITLMTHWTATEIKVALEWFFEVLFPLLMEKPKDTNFEKWFSVKIVFDITPQSTLDIECLKETVSDSMNYITKTKDALQTMNPSLEVTEIINENALCITSDSLYNFWKSRCPDAAMKINCMDLQKNFVKFSYDKFYFGNDRNCLTERESSAFVTKFFAETEALSKSPKTIREPQNLAKTLESLSPQERRKSSASDVCEMKDEIKASTSALSYIATTPEKSPSGINSMHDISSSGRYQFSENGIKLGNEQIREFQHQAQHVPNMQTQAISPNRLTASHDKSINQIFKSPQIADSYENKSENKSETLTNSSPLTANSRYLPLFSPANDIQPVICKTSDSPPNSNKSPRTDRTSISTPQSDIKKCDELMPENSSEKQGKFISHRMSVKSLQPLVDNDNMNNLISPLQTNSLNKKKKLRQIKPIKKVKATHSIEGNRKSTGLSSMTVAQPIIKNNLTTPVKHSLLKSKTISVNKTLPCNNKVPVKKHEITSSKKFQNFRVCVTPSDRTVNSPFNQSLLDVSETNQSNVVMNETSLSNTEEKSYPTFHDEVLVSDSSVVPKTIKNDTEKTEISCTNTKAGSSSSLSYKVSNSKVPLLRLPVSKVQGSNQELNECDISSRATESSIHSVDSLSKRKFTKTVNLKNMSSTDSNDIAVSVPFQHCNKDQRKTKPVIKRNFSTSVNKNISTSSKDKIGNHATYASGSETRAISFERNETVTDVNQNLRVNRVFNESSESFMPVSGSSNCSDEEFKKIIQFLQVKVTIKNKNLSPEEQNKRALLLAQTFISNNQATTGLDKRAMKLLTEFANHHV